MSDWKIGSVEITRIVEMEVTGGSKFILPDATPELCLPIEWLRPHFVDAEGQLIMSIHALVVDTGSRRILVDTCIGNDKQRTLPNWTNLQTSFLQDLEQAALSALGESQGVLGDVLGQPAPLHDARELRARSFTRLGPAESSDHALRQILFESHRVPAPGREIGAFVHQVVPLARREAGGVGREHGV